MGDAVGDVVERRPGQPLAGEHVRDARAGRRRATRRRSGPRRRSNATTSWAARNASRGESSVGPQGGGSANGGSGSSLLLAEALARRARAPSTSRSPVLAGALADPEDRDDDVLGEELEVDVVAARASAGRSGGRWRRCRGRRRPAAAGRRRRRPARPTIRSSSTSRPGIARIRSRSSASEATVSPSSSSPWIAAWRRAASSEAVSSAFGLVDSTRVTARSRIALVDAIAAVAEVEDRRLGDRADDLVGRGEDDVGAALERAAGQRRGEAQVRAPGLVDDQRHAARVGDLGEPGDVGDGAEVGRARRSSPRPRRAPRRAPASSASGVRQWAIPSSGSSSGATNRGRRPERTSPSMIEEWTLRWTTTRSPTVGERQADRVVAARAAVDQEPAPPRAPGLGGEPLGELERRLGRIGADVDALDPGRDVEPQRRFAERLAQRRVGARPALVAGDVEAARARGRRRRSRRRGRASRAGRCAAR